MFLLLRSKNDLYEVILCKNCLEESLDVLCSHSIVFFNLCEDLVRFSCEGVSAEHVVALYEYGRESAVQAYLVLSLISLECLFVHSGLLELLERLDNIAKENGRRGDDKNA